MSLNNYMPPENRKRKKCIRILGTYYVLHKNNIKKNINLQNILQNAKQESSCKSLENFSGEYYSLGNKILDFQFEPMCTKQTCPNYKKLPRKQSRKQKSSITNGVHIEAATRGVLWKKVLLTQEWCNWKMWKDASQLRMGVLSQNSGS